ncbi:MAG: ABC transporter permease, partial [Burkholderiales bacterium]|nr:ABC transporter permease [Burkholderiales bacterium]
MLPRIPFSYIARNLLARRLTTALTAGGMALVVFVFATVLMLTEGLQSTLVQTGAYDNAVVIRRAAQTEIQSGVERTQAAVIESHPLTAFNENAARLVSKEVVVLISLIKRDSAKTANVSIRGVGEQGIKLRPQVKLVSGRLFKPGSSEIIAGRAASKNFKGGGIGETVRFGSRDWIVVGVFDANGSGFDSELWGDAEQFMQAFRRPAFSSVIVRLTDAGRFDRFKTDLEKDPRLSVEAKRESVFYAEQSEVLAKFISYLGITLSVIFSIGATIGAMITMYASVANRVGEIGTLRALGFKRADILWAFLVEALLLALAGGMVGLVAAVFMQFFTVSTMNWQTFSELAFGFTLTPRIVLITL